MAENLTSGLGQAAGQAVSGYASQVANNPNALAMLMQTIKGLTGTVGEPSQQMGNIDPTGNVLSLLSNSIPQQEQQQQPKSAIQYMTENAAPLGIKSISHDAEGKVKVDFHDRTQAVADRVAAGNPPVNSPTQETPANDQGNTTPQNGIEILSKLIDDKLSAFTQNQPQVNRKTASGLFGIKNPVLGLLSPGSDTEQPGDLYKLMTLMGGGGAYKPSSETAYNANVLADITGMSAAHKEKQQEIRGAAYGTQTALYDKASESLDKREASLDKQFENITKTTRASGRYGGMNKEKENYYSEKAKLATERYNLYQGQIGLGGKNPNLAGTGANTTSHTPSQMSTYNKARSSGKSVAEAKKIAGL